MIEGEKEKKKTKRQVGEETKRTEVRERKKRNGQIERGCRETERILSNSITRDHCILIHDISEQREQQ